MGEPPPGKPRRTEHQPLNPFSNPQLRESLAIIFGLVFELRQGVEDLQFRLLTVDGNIAILLQLLTSMQEAIPSDLAGEATTANTKRATDDRKTLEPNLPTEEPHGIQHAEEAKEMDMGWEVQQDT
jgi:hypothetical protein